MTFARRDAENWHREIPGARWFKADLHIHTIDDLPGDRALVNAVVHRDYVLTGSDVLLEVYDRHVDVTSAGTLPNQMTVESVRAGAHLRSRNESIANYMLAKGFMEKRGRGWPLMRMAMLEFNETEPDIIQE